LALKPRPGVGASPGNLCVEGVKKEEKTQEGSIKLVGKIEGGLSKKNGKLWLPEGSSPYLEGRKGSSSLEKVKDEIVRRTASCRKKEAF